MAKFLRKPKKNIALRLAGILFCLTLVSFYMVSGLFAKYTTSGKGSDSARVIKFGDITLTETGDFYKDNKMWIVPGLDIEKVAKVSFEGSEAATYVFVQVQVSDHWSFADGVFTMEDKKISWTVADGWERLYDNVYYRALKPNETLANVDIIKDGVVTVSHTITRDAMETLEKVGDEEMPISIVFRAFAVQSNGFETPAQAWESLAGKGVGV